MENIQKNFLSLNLEITDLAQSFISKMNDKVIQLRYLDNKENKKLYFKQYYLLDEEKVYLSYLSLTELQDFMKEQLMMLSCLQNKVTVEENDIITMFSCIKDVPLIKLLEETYNYDAKWILSNIISRNILKSSLDNKFVLYCDSFEWSLGHGIYNDLFNKINTEIYNGYFKTFDKKVPEKHLLDLKRILFKPRTSHMKWLGDRDVIFLIFNLIFIEDILKTDLLQDEKQKELYEDIRDNLITYVNSDLEKIRREARNLLNLFYKQLGVAIIEQWQLSGHIMINKSWSLKKKSKNAFIQNSPEKFLGNEELFNKEIPKSRRVLQFTKINKLNAWCNNILPNIILFNAGTVKTSAKINELTVNNFMPKTRMYHSNNDFIIGKMSKIDNFNELSIPRYTLNTPLTMEFLLLFNKVFNRYGISKKNTLSVNKLYGVLEVIKLPLLVEFISELYSINFTEFLTGPKKTEFRILFEFCINLDQPRLIIDNKYFVYKDYYLNIIQKKITAKKLEINALIFNLLVLNKFQNFTFEMFYDMRGRRYPQSGLFSLLSKLTRQFISFNSNTLTKFSTENVIKLYKERLNTYFIDEVLGSSWLNRLYLKKEKKCYSLNKILINKNIKASKRIEFYTLLYDTYNMHFKKASYYFSMYNLDASSSGPQINSLLLQDRDLAVACHLVQEKDNSESLGLYERCSKSFEDSILELNTVFKYISESKGVEYQILLHNIKLFLKSHDKLEFLQKNVAGLIPKVIISTITIISKELSLLNLSSITKTAFLKYRKLKLDPLISFSDDYLKEMNKLFPLFNIENNLTDEHNIYSLKGITERISKTFLKTRKKEEKERKKLILGLFLDMVKLYEISNFYENQLMKKFINRRLFKYGIMITFYNGTSFGRKEKLLEYCMDNSSLLGVYPDNKQLIKFKQLSKDAEKFLSLWLSETYPKAFFFRDLISNFAFTKRLIIEPLKNDYFTYIYKPLMLKDTVKSIFNKSYKMKDYTEEIDYPKLALAWIPNFYQYQDATLMFYFYEIVNFYYKKINKKVPFIFTNHDCFYIEPSQAYLLKPLLFLAYKEYMDKIKIENYFKENKEIKAELINFKKTSTLTPDMLTIETEFVK